MATYNITATMNLNNLISEAREAAKVMNEFADNLEQIENKHDLEDKECEVAKSEDKE